MVAVQKSNSIPSVNNSSQAQPAAQSEPELTGTNQPKANSLPPKNNSSQGQSAQNELISTVTAHPAESGCSTWCSPKLGADPGICVTPPLPSLPLPSRPLPSHPIPFPSTPLGVGPCFAARGSGGALYFRWNDRFDFWKLTCHRNGQSHCSFADKEFVCPMAVTGQCQET